MRFFFFCILFSIKKNNNWKFCNIIPSKTYIMDLIHNNSVKTKSKARINIKNGGFGSKLLEDLEYDFEIRYWKGYNYIEWKFWVFFVGGKALIEIDDDDESEEESENDDDQENDDQEIIIWMKKKVKKKYVFIA